MVYARCMRGVYVAYAWPPFDCAWFGDVQVDKMVVSAALMLLLPCGASLLGVVVHAVGRFVCPCTAPHTVTHTFLSQCACLALFLSQCACLALFLSQCACLSLFLSQCACLALFLFSMCVYGTSLSKYVLLRV